MYNLEELYGDCCMVTNGEEQVVSMLSTEVQEERIRRVGTALEHLLAVPFIPPDKRPTRGQKKSVRKLQEQLQQAVQTGTAADVAIRGLRRTLAEVQQVEEEESRSRS